MNLNDISKGKEILQTISNELTIMNMITVLSNPELSKLYNNEERAKLEKYIKNNTMQYVQKRGLKDNDLGLSRKF